MRPKVEDSVSFWSRWTYSWVGSLVAACQSHRLLPDDLCVCPGWLSSSYNSRRFMRVWRGGGSWFWMLCVFGGWLVWWSGTLALASDVLSNASTQFMKLFLASLKEDNHHRYYYAAGLFAASLGRKIVLNRSLQLIATCAYMFRSGIMGSCYDRLLRARAAVCTLGSSFNRLAVDSSRIATLVIFGHLLWSSPLRICLSFVTVYQMVGVPALVGIVFILLVLTRLFYLARRMRRARKELASLSDARIQLTSEVLRALRTVKSLAMEDYFFGRLDQARSQELSSVRRLNFLFATTASLNFWAPMCAVTLTVIAAVLMDRKLGVAQIFSASRAFQQLMVPLWILPTMVNRAIAASVAANRLDQVLRAAGEPEMEDMKGVERVKEEEDMREAEGDIKEMEVEEKNGISLDQDGPFPDKEDEPSHGMATARTASVAPPPMLQLVDAAFPNAKPVSLSIKGPTLVALAGGLGSGKSTLLTHLAGLSETVSGRYVCPSAIGYCPYPAWLLMGTVVENVLLDRPLDRAWYDQVMAAVALQDELLPDQPVGEAGVLLSGGQRHRVALARALYGRPKLLLVDNLLASLDARVAAHVFSNCFGSGGIAKDAVRIVVMNESALIGQADLVIHMSDGSVEHIGPPSDYCAGELGAGNGGDGGGGGDGALQDDANRDETTQLIAGTVLEEDVSYNCNSDVFQLIWRLIKAVGGPIPMIILFLAVFSGDYLRLWRDMYLKRHISGPANDASLHLFVTVFSVLSALQGALTLLANMLAVWLCWRASRATHRHAIHRILHARMSALSQVPTGRLLNRLGRDLEILDYMFPEKLVSVMGSFSGILCTGLTIAQVFPRLLVTLLLPIAAVAVLQRRFARAWRAMLRLSGVTMAPLSALLAETMVGWPMIRVFHQSPAFLQKFYSRCDAHHVASFLSASTRRWVSLRVEVVASLYLAVIVAFCCTGAVEAGDAAMLTLYALQAAEGIDWFVKHVAEIDQSLVAAERISVYADGLPQEGAESAVAPKNVCAAGPTVAMRDVSVAFDGLMALRDVNLTIGPGERVVIVGRTGAGKSSIVSALLRLCDYSGSITLDGVETEAIAGLRRVTACVMQEAMLFSSATVRANLDPAECHTDVELWDALDLVRIGTLVRHMPGMLDAPIAELSAGQRQLLCIARAVLSTARLVLLDEATSALDAEADVALHRRLLEHFKGRTVVTVAHRLDICALYDRVIVISDGRVAEDGPYSQLVSADGPFAQLHRYK